MSHILFSGGGADGIAYTGVIQALEEAHLYSQIKHTAGTSIGAVFALLVACQIPSSQINILIKDYCSYIGTLQWQSNSLFNLMTKMTIDSGHVLTSLIDRVFAFTQLPEDITFVQFSKITGRTTGFCAVCLEKAYPTYFTLETTPDVKIYDALYASMALPILFPSKVIQGLHYIDGGFIDNFPLDIFLKQTYAKEQVNIQDIYGIYIHKTISSVENPCSNLFSMMTSVMRCIMTKTIFFIEHYIKLLPHFITLTHLPFSVIPYQATSQGFRLILTDEKINECIQEGYTIMKKKLESSQTST